MRRFKVKDGFSIHSDKGRVHGGDEFPESFLQPDHLDDLIAAGTVMEVKEEPPAGPAAENTEQPGRTGRKGR